MAGFIERRINMLRKAFVTAHTLNVKCEQTAAGVKGWDTGLETPQ